MSLPLPVPVPQPPRCSGISVDAASIEQDDAQRYLSVRFSWAFEEADESAPSDRAKQGRPFALAAAGVSHVDLFDVSSGDEASAVWAGRTRSCQFVLHRWPVFAGQQRLVLAFDAVGTSGVRRSGGLLKQAPIAAIALL